MTFNLFLSVDFVPFISFHHYLELFVILSFYSGFSRLMVLNIKYPNFSPPRPSIWVVSSPSSAVFTSVKQGDI